MLEDSTFTYAYDANGNLVEKIGKGTGDRTVYTYDAENQLIGVDQFTVAGGANPVLVADYSYDALGRRIEKNVNGVITRYVYDNEDIIFEADGTGANQAVYLHGPGIDEPLAATLRFGLGFSRFIYHADGLGSIATLTDLNGVPAQTYTYDSFGQIVDQMGTVSNPYTYTSRELDPETGLFYYRARYYDPTTGRFLQEDPIQFRGGDPNLYGYVFNNPTTFSDPSGLLAAQIAGGIIGAVIGGIAAAHVPGAEPLDVIQGIVIGAGAGVLSTIPIPGVNPVLTGSLAGLLGNLGAQIFVENKPITRLNPLSPFFSVLAGGFGGAVSRELGKALSVTNLPRFVREAIPAFGGGLTSSLTDVALQTFRKSIEPQICVAPVI